MNKPSAPNWKVPKTALLKAILLGTSILAAIGVARFTPLKEYLNADALGYLVKSAGGWAPPAFILTYAIGVCLFLPGTLLTGLGAAIFGPYYGFVYLKFRDNLLGTGLGIIVGTFIFTFFFGTLKEAWVSKDWEDLISFKVFFSVALFIFSFFIPKII